jgi:hypothetical protein
MALIQEALIHSLRKSGFIIINPLSFGESVGVEYPDSVGQVMINLSGYNLSSLNKIRR